MSDEDAEKIRAVTTPLLGKPAWGVELGQGSFLTLEFGTKQPPRRPGGKAHGEWHLWVYSCAWRLEHEREFLAGSADERGHLEKAVTELEGKAIEAVSVDGLDTTFRFSDGYQLRLFPSVSSESDHWILFTPGGLNLTLGPGATLDYSNS